MEQLVLAELRDAVAIVTINNPKTRNALSRELIIDLTGKIDDLMSDRTCRAIVLTGAENTFSSGGDVSRMVSDRRILDSRIWLKTAHRMIRGIVNAEKPVVAAVEGDGFGVGLLLAS